MGRLIDADAFAVALKRISEKQGYSELYMNVDDVLSAVIDDLQGKALYGYENCPTVEAIPKADIQKALKEGSKDISENVLTIIREEYISKGQYEARLKADMVAMLTDIQLEIEELKSYESADGQDLVMLADIGTLFQQKINNLKEADK